MEPLTKKEEEVMHVLWDLKKAFVKEIVAKLPKGNHYNTISTIIRHLETKKYVSHVAFGKTHQYFPLVSKEMYRKGFMKRALQQYFDNSYKNLVSFFVKEENISEEEMKEIIELIKKKK